MHLLWHQVLEFDSLISAILLVTCVMIAFLVWWSAAGRTVRPSPTYRVPHSEFSRRIRASGPDEGTELAPATELVHVRSKAYHAQHSPEPQDCAPPTKLELEGPPDNYDKICAESREDASEPDRGASRSSANNGKSRRRKKKRKSKQEREVSPPNSPHSSGGQNNVTRIALAVMRTGRTDDAHPQPPTPSATRTEPEIRGRRLEPGYVPASATTPMPAALTTIPGAAAGLRSSVCATTASPTQFGVTEHPDFNDPLSELSTAAKGNITTPLSNEPPSRTTSASSPASGSFATADMWYCVRYTLRLAKSFPASQLTLVASMLPGPLARHDL